VNCDKGQTLSKALERADPGDTIRVSGTCAERVVVTTDRITIDGQGSAILDGGGGPLTDFTAVVMINGARGVRIKGLTVRNSPGDGILAQQGAAVTVEETITRGNASNGIAVGQGSTAELTGSAMTGNRVGLDVYTGSSVVLRAAVTIDLNSVNGVEINGEAVVEIRAADVTASNNGQAGIVVGSGQLAIFGFPATPTSTLVANSNGFAGIIVNGSPLTVYSASAVTASGNGVFGILLAGPALFVTTPGSGGTFVVQDNAIGLGLQTGAVANFLGGQLVVNGNGTGLLANGAGAATFVSSPGQPSAIMNNGTDVDLQFGSRATFDGVQIGTLTTDGTVLCRGAGKPVCP
jgi:hypothetical protein